MLSSDDNAGWELVSKWQAEEKSIHLTANDGGAVFFSLVGMIEIRGEAFALVSESAKVVFDRRKVRFISVLTEEVLRETKLWGKQAESTEVDAGTDARYLLSVGEVGEGERVN